MSPTTQKPRVIAIVGHTASGKTDIAIDLALEIGGEIVSADSRQVYRGLDLGSGKVTQVEMRGVPHHLIDVADPMNVYSVADFRTDARTAIAGIIAKGKVPIICGGSGQYVDAALKGERVPAVAPNEPLRARLAALSTVELSERLKTLDPRRYSQIDRSNPHRLMRAIEVATELGAVPPPDVDESPYEVLTIGLVIPEPTRTDRIKKRLIARLDAGMLGEARKLNEAGLSLHRMRSLGLEYKYMADHLEGLIDEAELIDILTTKIRQYAKRQMTWFRRNTSTHWVDPTNPAAKLEVNRIATEFLR